MYLFYGRQSLFPSEYIRIIMGRCIRGQGVSQCPSEEPHLSGRVGEAGRTAEASLKGAVSEDLAPPHTETQLQGHPAIAQ